MTTSRSRTAIIVGAGPAGLTAAFELLKHTDIRPIVLEMSSDIGGICKTLQYQGNRIDIGGHRFFSKSDRVMQWWLDILPLQKLDAKNSTFTIHYQNKKQKLEAGEGVDPKSTDRVMLVRKRLSRIYFLGKFFDYPISLSVDTALKLGPFRMLKIGLSYLKSCIFPIHPERSLEDFFINRFGKELYRTFFKDYTEKVWGTPCSTIGRDWGAQRVKGLSIRKAVFHALKKLLPIAPASVSQKGTETSLIERFLYPKLGPGQLWEEVAKKVTEAGGEIHFGTQAVRFEGSVNQISSLIAKDCVTGEAKTFEGDYFFSTMPVKYLIRGLPGDTPAEVTRVAEGLVYRDFITVGVLLSKLGVKEGKSRSPEDTFPDNWIYIQEPGVKVGRIQVFNNWSPYMVKDPNTIWLGLEYFCDKGDELWRLSDQELLDLAVRELEEMKFASSKDFLGGTVLRMEKTYPAYFGTYDEFPKIREYVEQFDNLFLIGRNGMHRYNNQDHSMLTAMTAVENIQRGIRSKSNLWEVNTEEEYHEKK